MTHWPADKRVPDSRADHGGQTVNAYSKWCDSKEQLDGRTQGCRRRGGR